MDVLDLGCGNAKVEGAIGVDSVALPCVDIVADLDVFPYPFEDNSFDEIYLNDIIEHLHDTIGVMEEIYRIGRPGATVHVRVVNWNHRYAAMDPTHVSLFTENSFDFFGERKGRSYYTEARFAVEKVEYIFDPKARKLFRSEKIMYNVSRYLCNVLQGLRFTLRVEKPE